MSFQSQIVKCKHLDKNLDENMNRKHHSMLRILNTYEHSIYHVIDHKKNTIYVNGDFTFWSNSMIFRLVL